MTTLLLACASLFSGAVLTKILSKNFLFSQVSLNVITIILSEHFRDFLAELLILPDQGVD